MRISYTEKCLTITIKNISKFKINALIKQKHQPTGYEKLILFKLLLIIIVQ